MQICVVQCSMHYIGVGGGERIIPIIFVSDSDYAGVLGGCRVVGDTAAQCTLYTVHCTLHIL